MSNFDHDARRRTFSQLFQNPSVGGHGTNLQSVRIRVQSPAVEPEKAVAALLTELYKRTPGSNPNEDLELEADQWSVLQAVFGIDSGFKELWTGDASTPGPINDSGIRTVTAFELAIIYHILFERPEGSYRSHQVLHHLKKAAKADDRVEMIKSLTGLYNWGRAPLPAEGLDFGDSNSFGSKALTQLITLLKDPKMESLEPYGGTEPCRDGEINCY